VCRVPENGLFQLPFTAISGDVILTESGQGGVSDVFRIFNNIVNTGLGTGRGNMVFLYSADDSTPLPDSSTYSANAVFIVETPPITSFVGNGTNYLLGVPEPGTFSTLGLLFAAVVAAAALRGRNVGILVIVAVLCNRAAFPQTSDDPNEPGRPVPRCLGPMLDSPPQDELEQGSVLPAQAVSLPFFTANFSSLGNLQLLFNIVGTDPTLGANTTIIPTVIVPLKIVFPRIPGNAAPTFDATKVVTSVVNSPIFQNTQYTADSVDLGTTQFGDALQRAEFWNVPGFSKDYHVLLGPPSIADTVTLTVAAGQGNAYQTPDYFIGTIRQSVFTSFLSPLIASYTAGQLVIFLTDSVYLSADGADSGFVIFGYHASQSGSATTAKTWIYSAYAEPGFFTGGILDVEPLSHEIAEWLNDPLVSAAPNWVPPAVLPGQGSCIPTFETGDPLEDLPAVFTKALNGITYHLQDEVFLPWYLQSSRSFSVNGWYTFQNTPLPVPLVINSPSAIAGSYRDTAALDFAPPNGTITGDVVYIGRGCPAGSISPGSPADPYLSNPTGKIALIDRGACAISLKIDAAAAAGAIGVLIGLVAPGDAISFSMAGGSHFVPTLVITQNVSSRIKNALASSIVNGTISVKNASFSALCGPG
jgi:hypothetical protein